MPARTTLMNHAEKIQRQRDDNDCPDKTQAAACAPIIGTASETAGPMPQATTFTRPVTQSGTSGTAAKSAHSLPVSRRLMALRSAFKTLSRLPSS
jgi:hypothetical protein